MLKSSCFFSVASEITNDNQRRCQRERYPINQSHNARSIKVQGIDWEFLANGSDHAVYKATMKSDMRIGDVVFLKDTTIFLKYAFSAWCGQSFCVDPQELANAWNTAYPTLPKAVMVSEGFIFMAYIHCQVDEKGTKIQPTNENIIDELIRIYEKTRFVVVNADLQEDWIKTPQGETVCVDFGAMMKYQHFVSSPASQAQYSERKCQFMEKLKRNNLIDSSPMVVVRALLYLQQHFPVIAHVDFLENPSVADLLANAGSLQFDIVECLLKSSSDYVRHYLKTCGLVKNLDEKGSVALEEVAVALVHFQKSIDTKRFSVADLLSKRKLLTLEEGFKFVVGLNSVQLDVVIGCYLAHPLDRNALNLGVGIEFTAEHRNFLGQPISLGYSVSDATSMIQGVDEQRMRRFNQIYLELEARVQKIFLDRLALVQQKKLGAVFLDDVWSIWNAQDRPSSYAFIIFIIFYSDSPARFQSSDKAKHAILNAFKEATFEMVSSVLALNVGQLDVLYHLVFTYQLAGSLSLKAIPCFSPSCFPLDDQEDFLEMLGASKDSDVLSYVAAQLDEFDSTATDAGSYVFQ